jgi:hypothetical protein
VHYRLAIGERKGREEMGWAGAERRKGWERESAPVEGKVLGGVRRGFGLDEQEDFQILKLFYLNFGFEIEV